MVLARTSGGRRRTERRGSKCAEACSLLDGSGMRSSHIVVSAMGGLLAMLFACSSPATDAVADADAGEGGAASGGVDSDASDGGSGDARATDASAMETGPAPVLVNPGNDSCAGAPLLPLSAANRRLDLKATTSGATHDVDAPCAADQGPDVFYRFAVSKRAFVYADTFGASWNTVLFLLSDTCEPLAVPTMTGDAVCSDDACGTSQSRLVARLEPGAYRLGLGGRGGAKGDATIHFEWALAGKGTAAELPQGSSVQTGTTVGVGGNIDGLSSECIAAGAENSYWWARCPGDQGGTLTASTCGGTTWESIVEVQIPKSLPYLCNLDGCGLQSSLTATVPAGAGLGVLSIDGQGGSDHGAYSMTVSRP